MHVLIPTDGLVKASATLRIGARVLRPDDRNFTLLSTTRSHPKLRRGGHQRQAYERRILREITQILADAKADLGDHTRLATLMTEIGSPASVLRPFD